MAAKMDAWGVDGCKQNYDLIVTHLVERKHLLVGPLKLLPDAIVRPAAEKLLDIAIERAQATKNPPPPE